MTDIPAKTPRPIGRTDNFLPGNEESAATAEGETWTDGVEVEGVPSSGVDWIVLVVIKLVLVGKSIVGEIAGEDTAGELVLTAIGGNDAEGKMVEVILVAVVTVLDTDEEREPSTARVHVLTSRTASPPCASFIGVKTRTQVIVTVPIGESAVLTVVTVKGWLLT